MKTSHSPQYGKRPIFLSKNTSSYCTIYPMIITMNGPQSTCTNVYLICNEKFYLPVTQKITWHTWSCFLPVASQTPVSGCKKGEFFNIFIKYVFYVWYEVPVVQDREEDGETVHCAQQNQQVHKRRLLFDLGKNK